MNLYNVCEQLKNLVQYDDERYLDAETGELFTAEDIDALEMTKDEKIKNIIWLVKNLEADAEALRQEKAKFEARRKGAENLADRLREYLKTSLRGQKWKSGINSVSFRKGSDVKLKGDIEQVPREFLKYDPPTLRKAEIKKAFKNGEDVKGCYLVDTLIVTLK